MYTTVYITVGYYTERWTAWLHIWK